MILTKVRTALIVLGLTHSLTYPPFDTARRSLYASALPPCPPQGPPFRALVRPDPPPSRPAHARPAAPFPPLLRAILPRRLSARRSLPGRDGIRHYSAVRVCASAPLLGTQSEPSLGRPASLPLEQQARASAAARLAQGYIHTLHERSQMSRSSPLRPSLLSPASPALSAPLPRLAPCCSRRSRRCSSLAPSLQT